MPDFFKTFIKLPSLFVIFAVSLFFNLTLENYFITPLFVFALLGFTAGKIDSQISKDREVFFVFYLIFFGILLFFSPKLIPDNFQVLVFLPAFIFPLFYFDPKVNSKLVLTFAAVFVFSTIFFLEVNREKDLNSNFSNNISKVFDLSEKINIKAKKEFFSIDKTSYPGKVLKGFYTLKEFPELTVENIRKSIQSLDEKSVIEVSRWYYKKRPAEFLRFTISAIEALKSIGIKNPEKHILAAVKILKQPELPEDFGVGTVLISKIPFSEQDKTLFISLCDKNFLTPILADGKEEPSLFKLLINSASRNVLIENYPLDISAVFLTKPFFYNFFKSFEKERFKPKEKDIEKDYSKEVLTSYIMLNLLAILIGIGLILYYLKYKNYELDWLYSKKIRHKILKTLFFGSFSFLLFKITSFYIFFGASVSVFFLFVLFSFYLISRYKEPLIFPAVFGIALAINEIFFITSGLLICFIFALVFLSIAFFTRVTHERS